MAQRLILKYMVSIAMVISHGFLLADKNTSNSRDLTQAIIKGDHEYLLVFIKNGGNINLQVDGKSLLHYAAANGNENIFTLLVNSGAGITNSDILGQQPIHMAAYFGKTNIIELILKIDTTLIDASTLTGQTPLLYAASMGYPDTVHFLIKKGASRHGFGINDALGPWHAAIKTGKIEICKLLLREKIAPLKTEIPLLGLAVKHNNLKLVQFFLDEANAPVDEVDYRGQNSLSIAAKNGYDQIVHILLAHGATQKPDSTGDIPLHLAAEEGRINIIKILLTKFGSSINQCNDLGYTPLCSAVAAGRVDAISILLDMGAQMVPACSNDVPAQNAFEIAKEHHRTEVLAFLESRLKK